MKILYPFFLFLFLFVNQLKSQVLVGYKGLDPSFVDFTDSDLQKLKNSTTIFVLPKQLAGDEKEVEQIFKEVWTVSKYEIINYNEMPEYMNNDNSYSYFTLDVLGYKNDQNPFAKFYDVYFNLWMKGNAKNKKKINTSFAHIVLSQNDEIVDICKDIYDKDKNVNASKLLYSKAIFDNLTTGYLKTYLTIVNNVLLKSGKNFFGEIEKSDQKKLLPLAKSTLYIPDYILNKYTKSKKKLDDKTDPKKLLEDYPFKWKIISKDSLSEIILNDKNPFYFLVYVIDDVSKNYLIYNGVNLELICFETDNSSGFYAKPDAFKRFGKKISKSLKD